MSKLAKALTAAAGNAGGAEPDPNFNQVSLRLNGDGTDGGQNNTYTDASTNSFTITKNGDVTQGSVSPFGDNWANYFGAGEKIYTGQSSGLAFGTGDFTIETWVYRQTDIKNYSRIWHFGPYWNNNDAVGLNFDDGAFPNKIAFACYRLSAGRLLVSTTSVVSGQWYHVAVTRESGTFKLWINGVLEDTDTTAGATEASSTNLICVASTYNRDVEEDFNGFISNIRVVKGTAVYTANFDPPTEPLTAISGTQFLACQSNRFVDNSTNALAFTIAGTPEVTSFSPFANSAPITLAANGGSAYFDGSDYLQIPNNTALNLSGANWTVECWVKPDGNYSDYNAIFAKRVSGSTTTSYEGFLNISTGVISFYNGTIYSSSTALASNAWSHCAWVYDGTNINIYVNGISVLSTAVTISEVDTELVIGGLRGYSEWLHGYVSNLRILKGTALYTSAFTPPTAPLTAITNTELLLNFEDAAIPDYSTMNNVNTVGNADISTAVVKYGTGSLAFDGTGDYLSAKNSDANNLGDGDFTIELWFKSSNGSLNTHACLVASYSSPVAGSWAFKASSGSSGYIQWAWYGPSWNDQVSTTNVASDQQWHHCAVTRNNGNMNIWVDGVSVKSWTTTYNFNGGGHPLTVGFMSQDATSYINGNIDDLRITKGLARYTSTFTPPEAELPTF